MFIVSAVSSILAVRLYLHLLDYPSIGGARYHIAHVLWGGICMALALVLSLTYLGGRIQQWVAVLGGVGFGVFIDETGKFITRDNNYFFRPTVGIIYAIFVLLYLTISFVTRERKLTKVEYQMNALRSIEEAVRQDMDIHERAIARRLLVKANPDDPVTQTLLKTLREMPLVSTTKRKGKLHTLRIKIAAWYDNLWSSKQSSAMVRWFFVLETLVYVFAVLGALYTNVDDVRDFLAGTADYGHSLIIGQFVSTVIAALCVLLGLGYLAKSRLRALEWFRRATLLNLLLTQFFLFSRVEFAALPGFGFSLVLLLVLNVALDHEIRYQTQVA